VHVLLMWEGSILGELWCTCCYCRREQIGGFEVHMVLLWEGPILGEF
jgi:hypothetical protein